MKILTLNKKQEKLLISMCKEFFPEYHDTNRLFEIQGDEDMILMFDGNKYTKIHWYQLCVDELIKRIFYRYVTNKQESLKKLTFKQLYEIDGSFKSDFDDLFLELITCNHPVNFLYDTSKLK